ncbi:hypothetical protein CCR75_003794 [Bremia lactucae]|uniref:Telomerase reverse transcriptase n=1 Tax=Bremia lactucae TaxID=4779 RepID=A0A976IKD0_BRELC|nr:hypothetical protein CCR75_003794 [Bremia lactucae]
MNDLIARAATLRSYLRSAAQNCAAYGDDTLMENLTQLLNEDVAFVLDHTFLIQPSIKTEEAFPRSPWSSKACISNTELVHHAIRQLLARNHTTHWEDANLLTLGYREVTPGATGHRVTQSDDVVCYYPNTLVAALKKPLWGAVHKLIGDDLMMHLLLNFTIFVQLKETPDSYMQLAGKSLRQELHQTMCCSIEKREKVSINFVMYARAHRRNRAFASSNILVKASERSGLISRTEACRILRMIFPKFASQKRLSKRLINLIPTIQTMVSKFKVCPVEKLAKELVPVNAGFRKFMTDNPKIKRKTAEWDARTMTSPQPMILSIQRKAVEDGYLTQSEDLASHADRKRKRREEAIELLSNASTRFLKKKLDEPNHVQKKCRIEAHGGRNRRNAYDIYISPKLQEHKEDISILSGFATSKKKIYRLIRKFLASIVPKDIWGSNDTKKNWKCIKTMLHKVIFSRKHDVLSLKKLTQDVAAVSPNELIKRRQLVQELVYWVITSLVFPVLRNLFYVTEAEGTAKEVIILALDDLDGEILQPFNAQTLRSERQLATSRMRLLPKSSGIRPLMNLSNAIGHTKVSVNKSFEALHRVLTFEMERQPERLVGASVQNIDEIHARLKPLIRQITQCSRCAERRSDYRDIPMAYGVTVDVERCFDTIRPRKLYQMLKKALQEDEYLIRKHWVGHQVTPLTLADHDETLPSASLYFKLERPAYPSGELLGFDEVAARSKIKNTMLVDGVLYDYLKKSTALGLLKEHLSTNVVHINGHEFVQRCGIPQGSVISTILCNIYYAHFERHVLRKRFPKVCEPISVSCCQHEELFRYTDDFMFITTDLNRAHQFLKVMQEGHHDYGCFVNVAKSQTNFAVQNENNQTAISSPKEYLAWCGMLIELKNFQVYVNYEK